MKFTIAIVASVAALVAPVAAGPAANAPTEFFSLNKRAALPIPASKGSVTYKAPQAVSGVFDGGMKTYGRGVSCTGQSEGGDADAVFTIKNGGTLKNAIIGKDQIEGVHCEGSCTIEYVSPYSLDIVNIKLIHLQERLVGRRMRGRSLYQGRWQCHGQGRRCPGRQ
jgi:hypothetical protein